MSARTRKDKRIGKGQRRAMKIVRRLHMYAGLLLLPWVLLFGLSGMLFNHPEWFGPVEVLTQHDASSVEGLSGFQPVDAAAVADAVVSELNMAGYETRFRRAPGTSATVDGTLNYTATTDEGRAMVIISPNHGHANVRRFPAAASQDKPPFHQEKVTVSQFDVAGTEQVAAALLRDAGLPPIGPPQAAERGGAEVRFLVESENDGRIWNVSYHLVSGAISARAADAPHGMDFHSIVTRLHKTHHYPDRMGSRWLWSAFTDALGIIMVFWGISGVAMWWQIAPTRLLGAVGLSVAVIIAVVLFAGVFREMTFGPARSAGPGGKGSPPAQQGAAGKLDAGKKQEVSQP